MIPGRVYAAVDKDMKRVVKELVFQFGVPTSPEHAAELASALHPHVMEYRREVFAREVAALGEGIEHPRIRSYKVSTLEKLVRSSAGLEPDSKNMLVEVYDPETRKYAKQSVKPWTLPDDDTVKAEMSRRLSSGASRHIKGAGREAVIDASMVNRVRWARVLSGREDCGFCAMLASRGAVYARETSDFQAHDHCDCQAVMVKGNSWAGKAESDRLAALWKDRGNLKDFTKALRGDDV